MGDVMRYIKIFFIAVLWLSTLCATAQTSELIKQLRAGSHMKHASIGIQIVDVDTRKVIASHNATMALIPASVTKTLTAATVLKCYSPHKKWYTSVGYSGSIVDSVLYGDIIVRGSVDPSLANDRSHRKQSEFIDAIVSALQQSGVKAIMGDIIVDASICPMGGWGEWGAEDLGLNYGAGCYGVNYMGNEYQLYMHTDSVGTQPILLGTSTPLHVVNFQNYLTTAEKDRSAVLINPYTTDCILLGEVPALRDTFAIDCAMPDPPLVMAYDIANAARCAGVAFEGELFTDRILRLNGDTIPSISTLLYSHASDALEQMLRSMLRYSDNLYAEAMLRYVALSVDSVAHLASGLEAERKLWQNKGVSMAGVKLYDGSGLARKNQMTPAFIASFLVEAYHDKTLGQSFVELLPRAGREGTVRAFMAKKPLPGVLRLKSGSMNGVLCYAGYYTEGDKTYAVVLMSNKHTCKNYTVRTRFEDFLRGIFAQ